MNKADEPNEINELYRAYKAEGKVKREARRTKNVAEIYTLIDLPVEIGLLKLNEYQYRLSSYDPPRTIDLYPTSRRFHVIDSGKRGTYKAGALLETIKKLIK